MKKITKGQKLVALRKMEKQFPEGTVLFKEHDESFDLYLLLKGSVEVIIGDVTLATLDKPGTYFGEMSALLNLPRTATIKTLTDSVFIVVPKDQVERFFNFAPELAYKLAQLLATRLEATNKKYLDLHEETKNNPPVVAEAQGADENPGSDSEAVEDILNDFEDDFE